MTDPWRPVEPDALTTGIANITPVAVKAFLIGGIPAFIGCAAINSTRTTGLKEGERIPPLSVNLMLTMLAWIGLWVYIGFWYYQARSDNDPPF